MIALTPLDGVIDFMTASITGDVVRLMFGSLEGVLVVMGILVLSYASMVVAVGVERGEALGRVAKLALVILLLGWITPTSVTVWMTDSEAPDTTLGQNLELDSGGETSGWLAAMAALQDNVILSIVELLDADADGLGIRNGYVYGLTALGQAASHSIENPRIRDAYETFLSICLPRAYEAMEADPTIGSFVEWLEDGDTRISSVAESTVTLPVGESGEATGFTECREIYEFMRRQFLEDYEAGLAEEYGSATQAATATALGEAAAANAGYSGGERAGELAFKRFLDGAAQAMSNTVASATDFMQGLNPFARGEGRGEVIADSALGIFGLVDRLLDGGLTTRLMAIVLPSVLAVVRGVLYLLFVPAWLGMGMSKRHNTLLYWFGATAWVKAQYVVMALMLQLEIFFGRAFGLLEGVPYAELNFDSIQNFERGMSLVFFLGTLTGMAATAAMFVRGGGALAGLGYAATRAVSGTASGVVATVGGAVRAGSGGVGRAATSSAGRPGGGGAGGGGGGSIGVGGSAGSSSGLAAGGAFGSARSASSAARSVATTAAPAAAPGTGGTGGSGASGPPGGATSSPIAGSVGSAAGADAIARRVVMSLASQGRAASPPATSPSSPSRPRIVEL